MKTLILFLLAVLPCFSLYSQKVPQPAKQAATTLTVNDKALTFIAMGDWGRNGEYGQKEVAVQMGKTAKTAEAAFVIALGDNFYPSGVASTQDYSWIASYEQIYTDHSLQNDWYVVLGNHDYKGNVQAQVDYTKLSRRWHMPERYYSKKFMIDDDSTQKVLIVFTDTSPFVAQYYVSPDHAGNIKTQDTTAQKRWMEKVLSDPDPAIKWKIVVGHHPLYTGGKRLKSPDTKQIYDSFKPLFDKYKVNAYLCGHEHNLQYIKPPSGVTHYFVTGSGSELTPTVVHPDGGKFAVSENGFMLFSLTSTDMLVQVISKDGKILYKQDIGQ